MHAQVSQRSQAGAKRQWLSKRQKGVEAGVSDEVVHSESQLFELANAIP
jgi:hypothetical protein